MSNWTGVITNAGSSLLNEWVNQKKLSFDSAATGTGTAPAVAMLDQTNLVNQMQTVSITGAEKVSDGIRLKMIITAPPIGYTLNQYGVWASVDGGPSIMIALFQHDQGIPIPSKAESPDFAYTFYALISTSNSGTWSVNIDTSALVTHAELLDHITNESNPHRVTAEQVGAATTEALDGVSQSLSTHTSNSNNPHRVTAAQIGAATTEALDGVSQSLAIHTSNRNNPHGVTVQQIGAVSTADFNAHKGNRSNPHGVTKSQVGLGNVDNTSDANKPVSTAQASAIADAKKAGTEAQTSIIGHAGNRNNPHGVTAQQIAAAPAKHTHSVNDMSGILPVSKGGTGESTLLAAYTSLISRGTYKGDMNQLTEPGVYWIDRNVVTHGPKAKTQWGFVIVSKSASGTSVLQVFHGYHSNEIVMRDSINGWEVQDDGWRKAGDPLDGYPVGSVYLSTKSVSPAQLFGGSWVQLRDRVLIGAGGAYQGGETGGSTHRDISHIHGSGNNRNGTLMAAIGSTAASNINMGYIHGNDLAVTSQGKAAFVTVGASTAANQDFGHWTKIYGATATGGTTKLDVRMPYRAVYMWERIS